MDFPKSKYLNPIRIALIYFIVSTIWILFSDYLLNLLFSNDPNINLYFSIGKGLFFISGSAILIFSLVSFYKEELVGISNDFLETQSDLMVLLHNSKTGYLKTDSSGNILKVNDNFEKISGYSHDDLIGLPLNLFFKDFKINSEGLFTENSSGTLTQDMTLRRKDGSQVWLSVTATVIESVKRKESQIAIIALDISERKNSEKQLIESENKLKRFQRIGQLGQWEFNVKNRMVTCSDFMFEIIEMNPIKCPFNYNVIFKQIKVEMERELIDSISQNIDIGKLNNTVLKIISGKGNPKHILLNIESNLDENGNIEKYTGTLLDITEKIKMLDEFQESEKKFRNLFEFNPSPIAIVNVKTGRVISDNPANQFLLGYSESEIQQLSVAKLIGISQLRRLTTNFKYEPEKLIKIGLVNYQTKSKQIVYYDTSIYGFQKNGIKYLYVFGKDLTEYVKSEEKLLRSIVISQENERQRISKEIHDNLGQNIVAAFINFENLKNDISKFSEKSILNYVVGLKLLNTSIEESRTIAHNLMPKSLIEYGLVIAIESLLNSLKGNGKIKFDFIHNMENRLLSHFHELNLYRIVQEGINNIIKHSNATTSVIQIIKHPTTIILSIEDNGQGKISNSSNGYGLYIMRSRVEAMKGTIVIDSNEKSGTNITIEVNL